MSWRDTAGPPTSRCSGPISLSWRDTTGPSEEEVSRPRQLVMVGGIKLVPMTSLKAPSAGHGGIQLASRSHHTVQYINSYDTAVVAIFTIFLFLYF